MKWKHIEVLIFITEVYSELSQTTKIEHFVKIVNNHNLTTINYGGKGEFGGWAAKYQQCKLDFDLFLKYSEINCLVYILKVHSKVWDNFCQLKAL